MNIRVFSLLWRNAISKAFNVLSSGASGSFYIYYLLNKLESSFFNLNTSFPSINGQTEPTLIQNKKNGCVTTNFLSLLSPFLRNSGSSLCFTRWSRFQRWNFCTISCRLNCYQTGEYRWSCRRAFKKYIIFHWSAPYLWKLRHIFLYKTVLKSGIYIHMKPKAGANWTGWHYQ